MNPSTSDGNDRYVECPKCGYVREPDDYAPEWQCPKCQIVYAKYKESMTPQNVQQTASSPKKAPTAKIVAVLLLLIGGSIVVWKFESVSRYFARGDDNRENSREVTLYVSNACGGPCSRAIEFLKVYEVEYTEYNLSSSEEGLNKFRTIGVNHLPVVTMGNRYVAGYDEQGLLALLNPLITDFEKITPHPSIRVVMFSRQGCGYCVASREYFSKHGIKYTEYDIETSREGHSKFEGLRGRGVPLILIGDSRLNGFNENSLRQALKKEGLM